MHYYYGSRFHGSNYYASPYYRPFLPYIERAFEAGQDRGLRERDDEEVISMVLVAFLEIVD